MIEMTFRKSLYTMSHLPLDNTITGTHRQDINMQRQHQSSVDYERLRSMHNYTVINHRVKQSKATKKKAHKLDGSRWQKNKIKISITKEHLINTSIVCWCKSHKPQHT